MSTTGLWRFSRVVPGTAMFCIAFAVLAQNIVLVHQNEALRAIKSPPVPRITVNQPISPIGGLSLVGDPVSVPIPSQEGNRLLVISFSPNCPYCRRNQIGYRNLSQYLKATGHWQVVWVSRDGANVTQTYCASNNIPAEDVVVEPLHRTYVQLALAAVPQITVVGSKGTVEHVWTGLMSSNKWRDASTVLNLPAELSARLVASQNPILPGD